MVLIYEQDLLNFCQHFYQSYTVEIPFSLCKKCPSWSFLACIFPHSDWIWRDTEYLSAFSPNAGKCGPEKLQIPTLFTQCLLLTKIFNLSNRKVSYIEQMECIFLYTVFDIVALLYFIFQLNCLLYITCATSNLCLFLRGFTKVYRREVNPTTLFVQLRLTPNYR